MKGWTAAAAVALASCSGGGGGKDDAGSNAANGAAPAAANASNEIAAPDARPRLEPGQWEVTLEFLGMASDMGRDKMPKNAPLPPRTMRICVTAEQAARHGPGAILGGVNSREGRSRCSTAEDPVPSARIRSTVQCSLPRGGGAIRVDSEGRYSETTIEVEQQTQAILQGRTLTANTRLTGRRVGDCPR